MSLNNYIPDNLIISISGTILHSLWQGALISILLAVALLFVKKRSAKLRSALAYVAMITFLGSSIITFSQLYDHGGNETVFTQTKETAALSITPTPELNLASYGQQGVVALYKIASQFVNKFYAAKFQYVFTFWLLGVAIFTIRMFGGLFYTQRIKQKHTIPVANHWNRAVRRIADKLSVSKTINIFESPFIKQPAVIGYFKPVILFPIGLITGLPQEHIEAILAHEIAHIKRADYLLNLFQTIMEGLFFFNPAIWWFSSIIRKEREFSCDDLAVKYCGGTNTLSHALLSIEETRGKNPAFSLGLQGNDKSLFRRIRRMNDGKNRNVDNQRKLFALIVLISIFTTAVLFSGAAKLENLNLSETQLNVVHASFGGTSEVTDNDELTYQQQKSSAEKPASEKKEPNVETEKYDSTKIHQHKESEKTEHHIHADLSALEDLHFEFDNEAFEENMAQVGEQLSKLKEMKFKFDFDFDDLHHNWPMDHADSAEFHEEMEKVKEELASLKDLKIDIEWDKEEFKESMREFKEQMKKHKKEMANLGVEMKELKKEMKILGAFLGEVKKELVVDGHIDNVNDEVEFILSKDKMEVNGYTVSEWLHNKYLNIYKKHYGKELENEVSIHNR